MLFKYNCDNSTPDTFYRITGRPHAEGEIMPPRITWSTNHFKGQEGYFVTNKSCIKYWLEVLNNTNHIYIVKPLSTPVACHLNSDLKQWFVKGSIEIIKEVNIEEVINNDSYY